MYNVMNFNCNIDEDLILMKKYSLSPNELFVLKALLIAQDGDETNYLAKYLEIPEEDRGDLRQVLLSLQNKGIILKSYVIPLKGQEFDPTKIEINKVVFKNVLKSSFDLGQSLFDSYPMFGNINGMCISLRGVSKKFDSLEDFFRFYGKTIKWDIKLHNHILDLIDWEQSNNIGFINFSISTFVIEHKWLELEALKEGKLVNVNFNTISAL